MKVGLFIPSFFKSYDRVQSALWIRALQLVDPLQHLGVNVSINNPFKIYDVAIYHRGMGRGSVLAVKFLRGIAKRVYWDTCVDYFQPHEAASDLQVACSLKIAANVDGICVPTEGLAQIARQHCRNVFVMPDCINLNHFEGRKLKPDLRKPVFGWSGVSCKAKFLDPYAEFLDDRMVIVSELPPDLSFRYHFVPWRYESFPSALLESDVAFLPRPLNSTYNINNSSFKALVYSVLGIPIIASRLPSYELLAHDYEAISFLEDFNYDAQATLDSLSTKDSSPDRVRRAYDRYECAVNLVRWLNG